jgi:hypothetical protein
MNKMPSINGQQQSRYEHHQYQQPVKTFSESVNAIFNDQQQQKNNYPYHQHQQHLQQHSQRKQIEINKGIQRYFSPHHHHHHHQQEQEQEQQGNYFIKLYCYKSINPVHANHQQLIF